MKKNESTIVLEEASLVETTLAMLERASEAAERLRELSFLLESVLSGARPDKAESLVHTAAAIHAAAQAAHAAALGLTARAAFLDAIVAVRRASDGV